MCSEYLCIFYVFTYIGNSGIYVIVGGIIGVIVVLSLLLIIMICCFVKKKGIYVYIQYVVKMCVVFTYNMYFTIY